MTRFFLCIFVLASAFFGYCFFVAPIPLESHFLSSIPIKVQMLASPNVASSNTGQVSVEQVINQQANYKDMSLKVLAMGSAVDAFDDKYIDGLSLEDLDSISRRFGTDLGIHSEVVSRGFIEHQGKKGYELVVSLGAGKGEMVQHVYTHHNHLLLLIATYNQSKREKKTALAFLDSVEFL